MSMHDKTLCLFFNAALAADANTTITSKLVDRRLNGDDVDGRLYVKAQLGAAPTNNYVTFKLKTSADGSSWTDAISTSNVGATLYEGRLPLGLKRYLKAEVKVVTGLSAATTVFAEITDTLDVDALGAKQPVYGASVDYAAAGDAVRAVVES